MSCIDTSRFVWSFTKKNTQDRGTVRLAIVIVNVNVFLQCSHPSTQAAHGSLLYRVACRSWICDPSYHWKLAISCRVGQNRNAITTSSDQVPASPSIRKEGQERFASWKPIQPPAVSAYPRGLVNQRGRRRLVALSGAQTKSLLDMVEAARPALKDSDCAGIIDVSRGEVENNINKDYS